MTADPVDAALLLKLGFTGLVFLAILAVLTETYADVVLAATVLAIIWQVVAVFGASLFLATVLILIGLGLRVALAGLSGVRDEDATRLQVHAHLMEDLFADRERRRED
ncbi:hypothetical protein NGM10_02025 [Halorussus salilacus]|uniref:hypothetical protein n=1 Tax=Halorussus salilacus TaxID=2953750 RepID=UPI0020A06201|nr:hypothetical protein [Halorussus salilacus]USZ68529.1 hypothetical protein NGM10_02025 [Halorussus salilacus]